MIILMSSNYSLINNKNNSKAQCNCFRSDLDLENSTCRIQNAFISCLFFISKLYDVHSFSYIYILNHMARHTQLFESFTHLQYVSINQYINTKVSVTGHQLLLFC